MAKFRFKFATVLKVRQSREDEALRALADAQRAHQAALAYRAHLAAELERALARREELGSLPVTPVAFRLEQDYIVGTKQRIIQAEQAITRAKRGVEKALRAYLHARRQTKMIETLREKAFAEFRKQRAKREQLELDDQMIMRSRYREEIA